MRGVNLLIFCPRPTLSDSICGCLCARRTRTRTRTCCWVDLCPCPCPLCLRRRRRRSSAIPRSQTRSRWLASTLLLQDTNNNITMKAWSAITGTHTCLLIRAHCGTVHSSSCRPQHTTRAGRQLRSVSCSCTTITAAVRLGRAQTAA